MAIILPIMTVFQAGILNRWLAAVQRLGGFYEEAVKNEAKQEDEEKEGGAEEAERRGGRGGEGAAVPA